MAIDSSNSGDKSGGTPQNQEVQVKPAHPDSGQSAIEQLLSQDKSEEPKPDNPQVDVSAGGPNLIESEGVGAAAVAPVFIQPDDKGKFQFQKVQYVNTISEDRIIEENNILAAQEEQAALGSTGSEFSKQNLAGTQGAKAAGDLAFKKIYFAEGHEGASFNATAADLQDFSGDQFNPALAGGASDASGGSAANTNDAAVISAESQTNNTSNTVSVETEPTTTTIAPEPSVTQTTETTISSATSPTISISPAIAPTITTAPLASTTVTTPTPVTPPTVFTPNIPATPTQPVNNAPFASAMSVSMQEDGTVLLRTADIMATAVDPEGSPVSLVGMFANNGGSIVNNNDGTWTFTPSANFNGMVDLTFVISDGKLSSSQKVHVNVAPVNDAPIANAITYTMPDNGSLIINQANLLANAFDVDGDPLSVTSITSTQGTLVDNNNGTWTFTPNPNFTGTVDLNYSVTDGSIIASNLIHINVVHVNVPPVVPAVNYTIPEDGSILITSADLLANSYDPDGGSLTVTGVTSTSGTLVNNNNGTWTFTPNANFNGNLNLSFAVSDGTATVNQAINVTVTPVNDAPVALPANYTINEDNSLLITAADLLNRVTDIDSSNLNITSVSMASGSGTLTDNGNGTWTFVPNSNFFGNISLSYTVSDGALSATSAINITVNPINDAPIAPPVTYVINEDNSLVINSNDLLANVTDVDSSNLTVTAVNMAPGLGTLVNNNNGTWTFTPNANFNGNLNLTYTVSDGSVATNSTIQVTINPVNDAPVATPVPYTINEDSTLLITAANLLAYVTDVDSTNLTITSLSVPPGSGTLVDNNNGSWTFTPNPNFNGNVSLNYVVSDGSLSSTSAVNININSINDLPVASPVYYTIDEDNSLLITSANLLANVSDVDNSTLSITNVQIPPGSGVLVNNGNGTWSFTPNTNFNGNLSLSYTVSDGAASVTSAINVTVTPVNDAPIANPVNLSVDEDSTLLITDSTLLAQVYDVDNANLTITNVQIPQGVGSLTNNGDGTWSFIPNADFFGNLSLSYTVSDGITSTTATINVTVNSINDAPVATPVAFTIDEDNSLTITEAQLLANVTDVDISNLSITSVSVAQGLGTLVDNGNGTWTFTPTANFNGNLSLSYTVSDGSLSASSAINVTVNPVNDAPIATPIAFSIDEDNSLTITEAQLLANVTDVDSSNLSITGITVAQGLGTLVDNQDGTWTFTPNANFNGNLSLSYTVSDGSTSATSSINVTVNPVNDAPVLTPVNYAIGVNGTLIINEADLLANAYDVDGNTLSISSITATNGSLTNNGNGTWSFTPAHDFSGTVNLNYTVSDGITTSSQVINVNVSGNPPPTVPDVSYTMSEDGSLIISESALLANATDPNNDTLTVTNIFAPQGTITNNNNGTWTFVPAQDFNGNINLNFDVTDGTNTVTQTIHVNVTPVNDAPVANPVALSVDEDNSLTITEAQLLANVTDVDSSNLSITSVSVAQGLGTLVDNGNGTWTFTPNANFNGNLSLSYTVSDGTLSATSAINVTVNSVNDAPVANPVALSVDEDNSLTITEAQLLANVTDVDSSNLSITSVSVAQGLGTLVDNGNGTWTFTPNANFNGNLSLSYTVSDGTLSATSAINVTVNSVNDAPVANPVALSVDEDNSLTITEAQLLANVTDVDSSNLSITGVSVAQGLGTLVDNGNGTWTFTPNANFNGNLSLSYTVSDGTLSASSAINVTVNPVNDAPVANPVSYSVNEDTALTINAAALLANVTDIDSSNLTITSVQIPQGAGTLVDNQDGTWTFTPAANYNGNLTLSYTVSDGALSATSAINVTVNPVNDAPVANPVALSVDEDNSLTITEAQLLASVTDVDSSNLSITSVSVAQGLGTLVDNGNGTWTFTPNANFSGNLSLSYTVSDGTLSASSAINVTVNPVNDAPVANPVSYSVNEDTALTINAAALLANVTDIDSSNLTITSVQIPQGAGTLVDNQDGTWTFTPAANYNGNLTLSYTVSDGTLSATSAINVTVNPVNDAPVANPVAFTIDEDNILVITDSQLLANVTDVDSSNLSITSVSVAQGLGTLVDNGNGTWTFTPNANFNGNLSLSYTVSDGALSASSAINVTVNPVNDAPVANPVAYTIDEDNSLTITTSQLLANVTDIDSSNLSITNVSVAQGVGTLVDNGDGTWTFTPAANYSGNLSLSYTVSDGALSATSAINVTVNPVNDAPVANPVSYNVDEDTTLTINTALLLANVTDIDSSNLSIIDIQVPPGAGAIVDNGDGTWSYTPAANYNGNVSLSYTVSDGTLSATSAINVTVNPINDAPVANPVALSVDEDNSLTITEAQLLASVTDVDSGNLSITSVSVAQGLGTLIDNGNGTWTFTPNANFNGNLSLSYTVSDGTLSASSAINVTVNPINDAPVANPITLTTNEDVTLTITEAQLLANVTDIDSSNLSIVDIQVPPGAGSIIDNGDGTWSYTPAANYNGNVSLSYTVSDGALSATSAINVTVNPVNDAPVANPVALSVDEDNSLTITDAQLLANVTDIDSSNLSITGVSVAQGLGTLVDNGNGTWTFTPNANFNGNLSLSYTVSDGTLSASSAINVTVTPVNDAPVANPVAFTIDEDNILVITDSQLLANVTDIDSSNLSITSVSVAQGLGTLVDNGDGTWTFTPNANFNGNLSLSYTVSDGTLSATSAINVTVNPVNDAPVANPVALSVDEDNSLTINATTLLANVTDIDSSNLTITSVQIPQGAGTIVDNQDGSWTFTPAANYNGNVSLSYTVSDGTLSASSAINVTVNPVNDAPVANPVALSVDEDNSLTITEAQLLANVTDVDSSNLSITSVSVAQGLGTLVDNGNGTWTFTPNANFNGNLSLSYTVSDGALSASSAINVTVNSVNDAPVANPVSYSVNEDTALTINAAALLANVTDIDSSNLTITSVQIPQGAGTLVDNQDGTWTFTPAANYNGNLTLSYTVSDGTLSATSAINVTVNPVNDAPVANPVALSVDEDNSLTITEAQLLANVTDVDSSNLSITSVSVAQGLGTLVDNGNGTWTFTPNANFNGNLSLSYTVSDGTLSATSAINVTVNPVNDAPVANPVSYSVNEDTALTINAAALLANVTDIDSSNLTITSVQIPQGAGTLVDNQDGTWTFTPAANYNGNLTLSYTVSDGTLSATSAINVTVNPVNDAPVANPVALSVDEDNSLTITEAQLLASVTDVDSSNLSITGVSVAQGLGTLVDNGNGTWTFTPNANFNGNLSLSYTVSDGTLSASSAINVTVNPINDAPVANPVAYTIDEDNSLTITTSQLLANVTDIDSSNLSITNVSVAQGVGTLVDNGDGTWTFTPAANYSGNLSLSYTVSDGALSATSAINVTVNPVNDAPVANPVSYNVDEDTTLTINTALLLANVTDVDSSNLSIVDIQVPPGAGTIVDNGDGTWSYTPAANYNGNVSLSYTVSDGTLSATSAINVTVNPVNDAPVATTVNYSLQEDSTLIISEATLLANVTDVEGNTLSVTNITAPQGTLVNNGDGTWTFTPAANFNGTLNLTATISDGSISVPQTIHLNISAVNDAPVTSPVNLNMQEDGTITITAAQLLANTTDVDGDTLSVANLTTSSGNLVNNGNGTWSFTPSANFNGTINLTATITDGTVSVPQTVQINVAAVNDAPVVPEVDLEMNEDGSLIISAASLLQNATDIEGDNLSVLSVSTLQGSLTDNGNGTWTFVPPQDFNGDINLSFVVTDGTAQVTQNIVVTVDPINDAPVVPEVNFNMLEDGVLTINALDLLANATDIDGDTLSVTNLTSQFGNLINNGDGTWSFTPPANFNGSLDLTFTVSDGSTSVQQDAIVNVAAVNDAPVANGNDLNMITLEDGSLIIDENALLAHTYDVDGDQLNVTNITAANGSIVNNNDGTWTFTPDANFNGTLQLNYTVSDGSASVTQPINVFVMPVNDAPVVPAVTLNMQEDGTLLINQSDLLANAYDVDGNVLSVTNITSAQGTLQYAGNGMWSFAPNANFNGAVDLQFTVSDGSTTTLQTLHVNVNAVNDAPVVPDRTFNISEDSPLTITTAQLLSGVTDVEGSSLSVSNVSAGSGTLVNNGDGTWTFTPPANFNGALTLNYTITDGTTPVTKAIHVNVSAVNDAPVNSAPVAFVASEDGNLIITKAQLLGNTNDVDGDALSVSNLSVPGAQGTITNNGNGTWTFTPAANFNGTANISYSVSDGNATISQIADVTVTSVNDAPTFTTSSMTTAEDTNLTINAANLGATDVEGSSVTVSNVVVISGGGSASVDAGVGTYTPAANYNGPVVLQVTVTDGALTTTKLVTVNVTAENDAPIAGAVTGITTQEDTGIIITKAQLLSNTTDVDGDSLSISSISVPGAQGTITDNGNGTWTFSPAADFNGNATISFTASDGTLTSSSTLTVNVTAVNDAPVINNTSFSINEDNTLVFNPATLGITDLDGIGAGITAASVASGQGSISLVSGVATYTPPPNFYGTAIIQFTVQDTFAGTTVKNVVVTVNPVNDVPTNSGAVPLSMSEDGTLLITQAQLIANTNDLDGNTLTVSSLSVPGAQGTIVSNGNGTWTFTPNANFNGSVTINYSISDGTATIAQTANLTVTAVNDAPTFTTSSMTTAEDTNLTINAANLGATDVEGSAVTVSNVIVISGGGSASVNAGVGTYTPAANYNGPVVLQVTVTDGALTTTKLVTVNVTAANDAPVAGAVTGITTPEDTGVVITKAQLLSNTTDVDGDSLSISAISVPGAQGTITDNGNGTWTFNPAANFNGNATISFTASDGTLTSNSTLTVNVTAVNDAPTFGVSALSTNEDTALVINSTNLALSDIEGGALNVTAASVAAGQGTINIAGGAATFTPAANFNGTAAIQITVQDSSGASTTKIINVTVNPVNDAPTGVAAVSGLTVAEDNTLIISRAQLLGSAVDNADGDALSIVLGSPAVPVNQGTLTDNGNGTYTFKPAADFNGTATISYSISDGTANIANTASVTVTAVNDAPVVGTPTGTLTVAESALTNTTLDINLLNNASDIDGGTLSVSNVTSNAGTMTLVSGSTWRFTPTKNFNGTATIEYDVSDGQGGITHKSFDVTVNPDTTNSSGTVSVGGTYYYGAGTDNVTFNNSGANFTAYMGDSNDTIVISAHGTTSLFDLGDGNDTVTVSGNRNDVVVGGAGNDNINLGGGSGDVVVFSGPQSDYTFDKINSTTWIITDKVQGRDGQDTLTNVEFVRFNGVGGSNVSLSGITDGNNSASIVNKPADYTATEDGGGISITQASLLANATDLQGAGTMSVTSVTVPAGQGTISGSSPTWTFTPAANFSGPATITFTVAGTGGTGTVTVTQTATVNVTPVNDAPTVTAVTGLTTAEDTGLLITKAQLLTGSADIDGDSLSINNISVPANQGTITDNGNGTYTFVPAANFNGNATISFNVNDGTVNVANTATVNVTAVNDAPTFTATTLSATEDTPLVLTAANFASDAEGNAMTVTNVTVASGTGTATNNGNGTWTYTPAANFNGTTKLTITVSDGQGGTTTKTVSVNVAAANDTPTGNNVTLNTVEDTGLIIKASDLLTAASAADVDFNTLSVSAVNVIGGTTQGTLTNNGNGIWTFIPNANFNGSTTLNFTISDGTTSITRTLTVNVTAANDAPNFTTTTLSTAEDTNLTINATNLGASDVEGSAVTVSAISVVSGGGSASVNAGTGTYTPAANYSGPVVLQVTVTDGALTTTKLVTVNVTAVNDAPVVGAVTGLTTSEDTGLIITKEQLLANSSDVDADTLSITLGTPAVPANQGTLTDNGNGTYTFMPAANFSGNAIISYTVSDGTLSSGTTATVNVGAVNDAPTFSSSALSATEDTPLTISPALLSAADIENGTLSVTNVVVSPGQGSAVSAGGGNWTYTPAANFSGTATLTISVSDGQGGTTTKAIYVNVSPVNDTPTGNNVTLNTTEDTGLIIKAADLLTASGAADVDFNALSVSSVDVIGGTTQGSLTSNGNGTWTFVPNPDFNGSTTLNFTISDGTTSITRTLTVNVAAADDAPDFTATTLATTEDTNLTINATNLGASDVEGSAVTVSAISVVSGGGSATVNAGVGTYTPAANYTGPVVLQVTVTDGALTTTKLVTVNVSAENDAPTVGAVTGLSTIEDTGLIITKEQLLANSSDVDADALTISNLSVPGAQGTIVANDNGTYTFMPAADFTGNATISYTVSDGTASANTTATINVTAVNDAPTFTTTSLSTAEDTPLTINASNLGAFDVEGSAVTVSNIQVISGGGSASVNAGVGTYTPAANYNGTAVLQVTVTDGNITTTRQITVNVSPVGDVPVANTFALNMVQNTAIVITAAQILSNVVDADNDALNITALSTNHGTLTDNGNGSWTFVPDANYDGTVDLQYTVSDGTNSVSQTASINVAQSANDLQFNVDGNISITGSGTYTGSGGAEVGATYSANDAASLTMQQEASSGESSVSATSSNSGNIALNDFDKANIHLGNDGNSTITVNNSTSGNIVTGDGADTVNITTSSVAHGSDNRLDLSTGLGNDDISITGGNEDTRFNIASGEGNDEITLTGKYANADIRGGAGDDIIIGSSQGNDTFHFGAGQGNDTFIGGGGVGWADSIVLDSSTPTIVTQISGNSWTLMIDGQTATLTTDVNGSIHDNHIDFDGSAQGTITMQDGSTVNFQNIDHVEW